MNQYESSGNEFTNGFEKLGLIGSDSKENANKMSNTCNKKVSFGSTDGKRFTNSAAERVFEEANGTLNESTMTVKVVPMEGVARNTNELIRKI